MTLRITLYTLTTVDSVRCVLTCHISQLFLELCGDILRLKPKESDGVENVIVVDGLPEVGEDRLEKLKTVIRKLFAKFGNVVSDQFPLSEEGISKG